VKTGIEKAQADDFNTVPRPETPRFLYSQQEMLYLNNDKFSPAASSNG
jgi:hypothetical protein